MTDLEIFATIIAAIIHDFQHTGTTNNFHVMSGFVYATLENKPLIKLHALLASTVSKYQSAVSQIEKERERALEKMKRKELSS